MPARRTGTLLLALSLLAPGLLVAQVDESPVVETGEERVVRPSRSVRAVSAIEESHFLSPVVAGLIGLGVLAAAVVLARTAIARGRRRERLERKLEALYEGSSEGLLFVDRDLRVREANSIAVGIFRPRHGIVGMALSDLMTTDSGIERAVEPVWRGESVRIDGRRAEALDESGGDLAVEARAVDMGDEVQGVLVVRDVTRERASERTLRASEQRLRLLTQQMPAVLWTTDLELRFTSSTGSGLEAMGLAPGELVGDSVVEFLGEDLEGLQMHRRALAGESVSYEASRSGRTYETHVEPFRTEDGEIVGVIGVALDITERRRTEKELQDQTAYFTQLFEESPEAIVLLDEEDRVLRINREFAEMFGYAIDEVVGRPINELVVPPPLHDEAATLSHRIASGDDVSVEAIRQRKDGSTIHVSILGTPIEVQDGRHIYGIYRNITERKELESQLLQSQKLEAVGRLAGGVAHDFNNLMTAVLGHARLLRDELPEYDPRRDDLAEIVRSAERAAELTDQLLTFSRKDDRRVKPLDLNEVVTDMGKLLGRLIGEDVETAIDLDPGLPTIEGDRARIEQVIMNLAVNARDAMPAGGRLTIRTRRIEPDSPDAPAAASDSLAMLSVSDTGSGMTAEEQARMFEPFYTTKAPGKGTGLGLATVYGIVEAMSGHIEVLSDPGTGTDVRLFFPPCAEPVPVDAPAPESGVESLMPGGQTILLVEDEPSVRRMAQRTLERHGYHVLTAEDGEQALSIVTGNGNEPIDLLVSDVVMPGMSGHELGARIRGILPGIRAIFMSGYTDIRNLPEEFGDGEAEFLPKPFLPQTLARKARELLAG